MDVLKNIKFLSQQLDSQDIYNCLLNRLCVLDKKTTIVGIMGGGNSGKTTLINKIADVSIPVSPVSTPKGYFVSYTKDRDDSPILSESDWLKNNNISILEKCEKIFSTESNDIEYIDFFSDIDICVYMIDAQMAYTRNDALIIEHLLKFGIPTIACISKYEKLQDDAKAEVYEYLSKKLSEFDNLIVVANDKFLSLTEISSSIKDAITKCNVADNIKNIRKKFSDFYIADIITNLTDICNLKLKDSIEKDQKQKELSEEKLNRLSALSSKWMKIELDLTKRRQQTEELIRKNISNRKSDMIRRISHDIDICSDVKVYWEKELGYRIDDMMRAELQSNSQLMNRDIILTLKWLQDEILKSFGRQISIPSTVTCVVENQEIPLDSIDLADSKNLKIITRVGTAATVIVAGTLLATSGIGGAFMAVSMLSGIGAEWWMGRKSKESKTKVMELLPSILDRYELVYVSQIFESLKASYDEIFGNLKNTQREWKEKSEQAIENERVVASSNSDKEKYLKCLEQLKEISKK